MPAVNRTNPILTTDLPRIVCHTHACTRTILDGGHPSSRGCGWGWGLGGGGVGWWGIRQIPFPISQCTSVSVSIRYRQDPERLTLPCLVRDRVSARARSPRGYKTWVRVRVGFIVPPSFERLQVSSPRRCKRYTTPQRVDHLSLSRESPPLFLAVSRVTGIVTDPTFL